MSDWDRVLTSEIISDYIFLYLDTNDQKRLSQVNKLLGELYFFDYYYEDENDDLRYLNLKYVTFNDYNYYHLEKNNALIQLVRYSDESALYVFYRQNTVQIERIKYATCWGDCVTDFFVSVDGLVTNIKYIYKSFYFTDSIYDSNGILKNKVQQCSSSTRDRKKKYDYHTTYDSAPKLEDIVDQFGIEMVPDDFLSFVKKFNFRKII